jgi:hypothetical protein
MATHFFQDLPISWLNPSSKAMINLSGSLKILFRILIGSYNCVATRLFQDLVVSSGNNSQSLQDPGHICQGSGTETSKIFPRAVTLIVYALSF